MSREDADVTENLGIRMQDGPGKTWDEVRVSMRRDRTGRAHFVGVQPA